MIGVLEQKSITRTLNTFIGGEATYITSASVLASITTLDESYILDFTIIGDDIQCYIGIPYAIKADAFNSAGSAVGTTYYIDTDNMCKELRDRAFYGQDLQYILLKGVKSMGTEVFRAGVTTNRIFDFPLCTEIGNLSFYGNGSTLFYNLPLCTTYGDSPTVNNGLFTSNPTDGKVYAHPSMQTINAGGLEADLNYLVSTRSWSIAYSSNQTAPSSITDLAVSYVSGTYIDLSWTAPSTTNALDFYEIWQKGTYWDTYIGQTTGLTYSILGLSLSTSYQYYVKATDIYYNQSDSNIVTQTTSATYFIPTANIISMWQGEDATDSVGSNNGTATSMSYVAGLVGNCLDFTAGTSSKIQVADADTLSFGNGTTDLPFSNSFLVKWNATPASTVFLKKANISTGLNIEYQTEFDGTYINFYLWDLNTSNSIRVYSAQSFSISTWYHLTFTYDGSGVNTGMEIYVDGSIKTPTRTITGTYVAMENLTEPLTIGKNSQTTTRSLNGYMDEVTLWDVELTAGEVSELALLQLAGTDILV